jgi:hypothetical protein
MFLAVDKGNFVIKIRALYRKEYIEVEGLPTKGALESFNPGRWPGATAPTASQETAP